MIEIKNRIYQIGLINSNLDEQLPGKQSLRLYFVRYGQVRILFNLHNHRISAESFNIYKPGRMWVRSLFSILEILNKVMPRFVNWLSLKSIAINPESLNIQIDSGFHAIFLGADVTSPKITILYKDHIVQQGIGELGGKSLAQERVALIRANRIGLKEFLVPYEFLASKNSNLMIRYKFILQSNSSWNELKYFLESYLGKILNICPFHGFANSYPAHGDLVPWNIRISQPKSFIVDWETFCEHRPFLYDLFYFFFMQAALHVNRYNKKRALIESKVIYQNLTLVAPLPNFDEALDNWISYVTDVADCPPTLRSYVKVNFKK